MASEECGPKKVGVRVRVRLWVGSENSGGSDDDNDEEEG